MEKQFAVVTNLLEPISIEVLERAFGATPGMTAADAHIVVNGSRAGVLARYLTSVQAASLRDSLGREGLTVEVVNQSELPVPPPGIAMRWMEFTPEAMATEDQIGRPIRMDWAEVGFLIAGSVREKIHETEEVLVRDPFKVKGTGGELDSLSLRLFISDVFDVEFEPQGKRIEKREKEIKDWFLRLEIISRDGARHYTVQAEKFNFACLGEDRSNDLAGNFCLLVRKWAERVPWATVGPGIKSIVKEPCEFVYYPRKTGFYDEISWMLWRSKKE
jgi:hypothetical protein